MNIDFNIVLASSSDPRGRRSDMTVARLHNILLIIILYLLICGKRGTTENIFLSEPTNITILEGESTQMNCTTLPNDISVIWILNGRQYYWSHFNNLDVYTLNALDNSLTINNAPRALDNTSFQCVVNNHPSAVGYLTVLNTVLSTSTMLITAGTTSSQSSIGHAFLYTSSSLFIVRESPSATAPTTVSKPSDLLKVFSSLGVTFLVCICLGCVILNLVLVLIRAHKSKSSHSVAVTEDSRNQV